MRYLALLLLTLPVAAAVPKFRAEEIDKTLKIGYGLVVVDINNDAKPDVLVVDKERVVWFENPTWKLRTVVTGKTKLDNVCVAAADIDGDGLVEIALGGNWMKMTEPAALYWLKRGKTLDDEWTLNELPYDAPTLHRIRFADLDGDKRPELIVAPLHGLGATAAKNFAEAGPKFGYYKIPADPAGGKWEYHPIDDTKHVMHNFLPVDLFRKNTVGLLAASYEGVFHYTRMGDGKWLGAQLGEGNQDNPTKSRGSSEVRVGQVADKPGAPPTGIAHTFIATIEPFHGHQVVVYTPAEGGATKFARTVIDDQLKSGHALGAADLDGDGTDEIVMGFRDPLAGVAGAPPKKVGINAYHLGAGNKWERVILDDGGMACEDLAVADLNADGRPDIVAVGRATKNVKIYWNEGK